MGRGLRGLRRKATRSAYRNVNRMGGGNNTRNGTIINTDPLEYYFRTYQILVMGLLEDMLPKLKDGERTLHNGKYEHIDIKGKIGLLYLDKISMFAYVLMNDDYHLSILFKNRSIHKLPFIERIKEILKNQELLPYNRQILKVIHKGSYATKRVYSRHSITDLTEKPPKKLGITEVIS